ncbi:fibronectin type III domain-containing protein [Sanguibacter sp. HDW7]|uniref:fibronectin type III domain-containing protein n=1 Tax=Sanguibacter sp. HDW7 TaxID=2714931 RepID=UPI00140838A4|nr:fibronectin type III domain-containing protein [Sanguibacter sp. HDW7]QIK83574.1 hypothetical protein G7063_07990 [Sanguibacter sp. HDW7]
MRTPRIVAGATAAVLALGLLSALPASATTGAIVTLNSSATATGRTGDIVLAWQPVPGATQYKVEIAETESFGSSVVDSVTTYGLRWVPTTPLWGTNGDRQLFWRVVPVGVTTDIAAANVGSFVRAEAPTTTLLAPAQGADVAFPTAVTFTWQPVTGASSYDLTYGASSGATPTLKNVVDTTWTPALLPAGTYEWSVTPRFPLPTHRSDVAGTPSATRSFTVPKFEDTVPGPGLVTPAHAAFLNDPEFRWNSVDGVRSYVFQLSTDPNFVPTAVIVDAEVASTAFTPVHTLLNGTYYWRVGAKAPNGSVTYSGTRQFAKRMTLDESATTSDATVDLAFTNISATGAAPSALDFDRFYLAWNPVPRATFYEVTVTRQRDKSKVLTCRTGSTSATIVGPSYIADPKKVAGAYDCLWSTDDNSAIRPGDDLYLARVRAINVSAADTYAYSAAVNPRTMASTTISSTVGYFTVRDSDRSAGGAAAQVVPLASPTQVVSPRIEWQPVTGATGYLVNIYSDADGSTIIATLRTTTATVQMTGVFELNSTTTSDDAYKIEVFASSADWKKPTEWRELPNTKGDTSFLRSAPTPAAGTVVDVGGAKLLRMTPTSASALGGANRGYQVNIYKRGMDQTHTTLRVDQPSVIAAQSYSAPSAAVTTMKALPTGEYSFAWAVIDPVGKVAQESPRVDFTIGGATPSNLVAKQSASGTSAALSWKNNATADSYTVKFRSTTDARTTTYTTSARSVTATGLLPGATYEWSVSSTSQGNVSYDSPAQRFTVPRATVTLTSGTLAGVKAGEARIAWSAVPGASRYLVRVAPASKGLASTTAIETSALSYVPTIALAYGTAYTYDVRAVPPVLTTASTRPVLATTVKDGSLTVITAPGTPSGLKLTANASVVTATWSDLVGVTRGSAIAPGYLLRYGAARADGLDPSWTNIVVGSGQSRTVPGLKPGTQYAVQVAAANTAGQSPWSRTVVVSTAQIAPSAPRIGTVSRASGYVTARWGAPTSANSGVTGYLVQTRQYSTGRWSAWKSTRAASTARSAKVTGLKNGLKTEVRVIATSKVGNSRASASKIVTPAGKPLAPTVKASSTKKKTVKVTWKAASSNGSTVTGYTVQYSTNGKSWKTLKALSSKSRSYTWTKAASKKSYYFRVQAKNALGSGAYGKTTKVTVK